jgi:hypothetical protein
MKSFVRDIAKFGACTLIAVIGLNCVTVTAVVSTPERVKIEIDNAHRIQFHSAKLGVEHKIGYDSSPIHIDHTGYIR